MSPTSTFSSLRIGALQEPNSLNPVGGGVLTASYTVFAHVYELLVGIGVDLAPVPALAQSWSVTPDNLVWTFHLVRNATWHDGRPFTAEDVNFTYRMIAPAGPGNPVGCDLPLLQGYLGGIDVANITVLDPYTIRIPTSAPKANMLSVFIQILPKHIWAGLSCVQAAQTKNQPPVGTGMYKWTAWYRGAYTQLDLNSQYWRLDRSQDYVDQIIIIYYKDSAGLYNAFVSGKIDATDSLASDQFLQVPDNVGGSAQANVIHYKSPSISFAEMGACVASDALIATNKAGGGRSWLVTNLTVRQALQISINRSFLVGNIIKGLGTPGSTLIPPATAQWHYNVTPAEAYSFNPARARALLDDPAGDGVTLRSGASDPGQFGENLNPAAANNQDAFIDTNGDHVREAVNPSRVVAGDRWGPSAPNRPDASLTFTLQVIDANIEGSDAATRMIQWWADVGIKVTKNIVTSDVQISTTYDCSEDLYIWGFGGDVDPDFLLSVLVTDQILYWQDAWYSNATYDQLYVNQQTQVDPAVRQATAFEMQRIAYHDAPYLILWYPYNIAVVRSDRFSGWGDWIAHSGLGLAGFGNDFIMLTLRAGATPVNNCPLKPVIEGPSGGISAFVNETKTFGGASGDADANSLTWIWSWDEGNATDTVTLPNVKVTYASYAWPKNDTYNVTLTVDDGLCPRTSGLFAVKVLPRPAEVGYIAGTVRDASSGSLLAGASVSVNPGSYGTTTDPNGTFNVTAPLGSYTVTASGNLYGPQSRNSVAVTANTTTAATFSLTPVRGWITGTVTISGGGTLSGVAVIVSGTRPYLDTTSSAGSFNISVAPGTYSVGASHSGYVNQTKTGISVTDGTATTVNFELSPVAGPPRGLDLVLVGGIGLAVLVLVIALVSLVVVRKRKKEEEIQGPPMPPQPPPPPAG